LTESPAVRLLFIGDVVGGIGRRTMASLLPGLRDEHRPDFVVVNGENAAGGVGITEKTARELFDLGAAAIATSTTSSIVRRGSCAPPTIRRAAPGVATPSSSGTASGLEW
jgi:hypothetical protein